MVSAREDALGWLEYDDAEDIRVTGAPIGISVIGRVNRNVDYFMDFCALGHQDVPNKSARWHVHFNYGTRKIVTVRWKPDSASPLGDNLFTDNPGIGFRDLIGQARNYPNTHLLLTRMRIALLARVAANPNVAEFS